MSIIGSDRELAIIKAEVKESAPFRLDPCPTGCLVNVPAARVWPLPQEYQAHGITARPAPFPAASIGFPLRENAIPPEKK
jgi:hypothetical protein